MVFRIAIDFSGNMMKSYMPAVLRNSTPALVFLIALCTSPLALAAKSFVVGVENHDYLPAYGLKDGQYHGFARELFDAFAKDRGYIFDYRALPVPRLYASFFNGQIDFKFPDNPQWKQDQRSGKSIHYSAPALTYIDGVVVPADRTATTPDEIRTLGTVAGFTPWAWMDRVDTGKVKLVENASFEALVRQVVARRIDGAYANIAVVNYQLDKILGTPGALVFAPQLPYSRDHYHLSTLKHADVIQEFNVWLKQNGSRVEAMKKRHAVEAGLPPK